MGDGAAAVVAPVAGRMRRLRSAAAGILRGLIAAVVIALLLLVLQLLAGLVLVEYDALFR